MAQNKRKITNEQLCAALMTHGSIKETAQVLDISEKTVYNRMNDDKFKEMFSDSQKKMLHSTIMACQNRMTDALNCVAEIMNDPDVNAQTRLLAAQTILKNGMTMCKIIGLKLDQTNLEEEKPPFEKLIEELGI